ncbi:MAG: preprotein translocase subunit SecY [Deltaproteobacteria bacterium]|nr:preprotein translocase subunit SecY [Deltaproteobacteria bacterium]
MASLAWLSTWYKIPELRRRMLFTLALLAVFRVGAFVTTPGVDRNAMRQYVASQSGSLLGFFNLFSGGALSNLSIFALGVMPYISASIILQLLGMVYKPVDELRKEGEAGRRKIDQYTRYGTVALSAFQGFSIAKFIEGLSGSEGGVAVVNHPGLGFELMTVLTLTTGTAFLMWLGEQITERGIGNGISLIIQAGIVVGVPRYVGDYFAQNEGDIRPLTAAAVVGILVGSVAFVAFFENARRLIPIVYSRRQVSRRVYGGQTAHLPLKINTSGVIPPIFASSLLMFPATLASLNIPGMDVLQDIVNRGDWVFNVGYGLLIIFFCFFYTNVVFKPIDVAENLKKQQANIPGIRPGKQTAEYIDHIMQRITFAGAIYCAAICVIPSVLGGFIRVPITFGGTTIMIVVGVALDTIAQIESHMLKRSYDGLAGPGAGHVRGRRLAAAG